MTETIILTGAIRPSWPLLRNDPVTRLTDYLCAIRRWLDVPTLQQVIYCDASGCVIPEEMFGSEKFESLSFDASELARKYEAGRAEAETLAFVLEKSRFRFDVFYKCTGRNCVENFEEIRCDMRQNESCDFFLRPCHVPGWADTRFFRMTTEIFQQWIKSRIVELTGHNYNGHVIESLFFEYLNRALPFPEPVVTGYGGHSNQPYQADYSPEEKEQAAHLMEKYGHGVFGIHST